MSEEINMCLSGGAKGADHTWGLAAEQNGHEVVHWSFENHNPHVNKHICELDDTKMRVADPFLDLANKSLYRQWPTSNPYTNNLLRRNFYQVYWSTSVYAIANFQNDQSVLKVAGGTAWACQMYVDKWLYNTNNLSNIGLYLFDQISKTWYTWTGQWQSIIKPPRPSGVYAGIGTRQLTPEGKQAIIDVYG